MAATALILVLPAALAASNSVRAASNSTVYIIRHGEKDHASGNGLAPAGRARAQYLARCMSQRARSLALPNGPPTLLMASESKKGKSHRSEDTVRPLADALHLDLDTSIKSSDVKLFAERTQEKLAADGTLVAAWHHETAPKLVEALLGHYGYQPEWPSKWPHECDEDGWSEPDSVQKGGRCYDLLWRMTLRRHHKNLDQREERRAGRAAAEETASLLDPTRGGNDPTARTTANDSDTREIMAELGLARPDEGGERE